MSFAEEECFFYCPYCNEKISMVFDFFSGPQKYIEDCEVCCRPIEVSYQVSNNRVINLEAKRLDD